LGKGLLADFTLQTVKDGIIPQWADDCSWLDTAAVHRDGVCLSERQHAAGGQELRIPVLAENTGG
ncbi:hypothetical protein, partial [uncultured Faecalibaculum sp.]|uniref:hypothetical protein n=1 Tax=uncultured Faecalibaculum sp. TaxID=1729681 RepID=UPI00260D5C87